MKKNKLLFIATLSATCLFSLASCQGAQGPKGDTGTPGINGTNGVNGKDGVDGSSVLTGKGVPASTLGSDGDSYIDTDTFDFYSKADGKWSKVGNIKGTTGEKGTEGEKGEVGKDGTSLLSGNGVPSSELGSDGDSYIDLDTFDFYLKKDGVWSIYGNMKGADGSKGEVGETGKTGTSVLTGKGVPTDSLGNDGDSYIDTSSFDFYTKEEGKWSKVGSIKGDKGEAGEKGDKGNTGWSGSKGDKGSTAWSNTILPTKNGYVTVDKGSEVVGENNYFTFKFVADPNYKVSYAELNGVTYAGFDNNTLKVPVIEGGYVVKATFVSTATHTSEAATMIDETTGATYEDVGVAIKNGAGEIKLTESSSFNMEKDYLSFASVLSKTGSTVTIDLNGYDLGSEEKTNMYVIQGNLNIINSSSEQGTVYGSLVAEDSTKVTLKNIKIDNKFQFAPSKNGDTNSPIEFNFEDVDFEGGVYGFRTRGDSYSTTNYGTINFKTCSFEGFDSTSRVKGYSTGAIIDLPCTVNFDGCEFIGSKNALIVRAGNVTCTHCTFTYDGTYDGMWTGEEEYYLDGTQDDSNGADIRVATAMIALGNANKDKYFGGASLKLVNCSANNTTKDKEHHKELFLVNDGAYNTSIDIDEVSLGMFTKSGDKYTEILYCENTTSTDASSITIKGNNLDIKSYCTKVTGNA